jgi:hypothetical protein
MVYRSRVAAWFSLAATVRAPLRAYIGRRPALFIQDGF